MDSVADTAVGLAAAMADDTAADSEAVTVEDTVADTAVDTEATSVASEVATVRVKARVRHPAPVLVSEDLDQVNPVPAPVPVHSADGELGFHFRISEIFINNSLTGT